MTIFRTKLWIPAIILIIILITAAVVIIVFQIRINQLNNKVDDLNDLLADEKQTSSHTMDDVEALDDEIDALQAEKAALSAQIVTLSDENETLKQYQLTMGVPDKNDIVIDQRLEPELVDLIKTHYRALAAGNIIEFQSTLISKEDAFFSNVFAERKNTDLQITSISAPESLSAGTLANGPFYLPVTYRSGGELKADNVGVTKIDGKWVVYYYD